MRIVAERALKRLSAGPVVSRFLPHPADRQTSNDTQWPDPLANNTQCAHPRFWQLQLHCSELDRQGEALHRIVGQAGTGTDSESEEIESARLRAHVARAERFSDSRGADPLQADDGKWMGCENVVCNAFFR